MICTYNYIFQLIIKSIITLIKCIKLLNQLGTWSSFHTRVCHFTVVQRLCRRSDTNCWGAIFASDHSMFLGWVQLLSHVQLCNSMDCSMSGLPAHHQLPGFAQTHVHRVSDAIQPSHLLSSTSAFNLYLHQGLFKWVSYSHQLAKVLEFQLQHKSFQWIFRTDFL